MKKILASLLAVVVLLAVMVTPVMADTGSTEITGTVEEAVEVSAPAAFGLGVLTVGGTTESGEKTVTVDANHAGWTLEVHEADGEGKMSTNGDVLTNEMQVKGGDITSYTNLGGNAAKVTLEDSGAKGTSQTISVYFSQAVTWGDVAGTYSITLTFTATAATP